MNKTSLFCTALERLSLSERPDAFGITSAVYWKHLKKGSTPPTRRLADAIDRLEGRSVGLSWIEWQEVSK